MRKVLEVTERFSQRYLLASMSLIMALVLTLSTAARAELPALITKPIDPAQRKSLGNSVPPMAALATDRGHVDGATPMKDLVLMMQPSKAQSAALKKQIDDMHNATSPNFHKWLTPEQFAAQYGASDADLKTVTAWLTSNGFNVEQTARGKNWIRFSGSSSQVESAFKTSMHSYSLNGAARYANTTALSIPAALAPAVAGIISANNFGSHAQHVPPSTIIRDKTGKFVRAAATASANAASGTSKPAFTGAGDQQEYFLAPADFAKIYNTQPLISAGTDGTDVSIAIVGRSDIEISDVEAFRTIAGLPFNDPKIIYATTDPGDVEGDDVEASLDVEWSGAIAPHATINYVIGATTSVTDGVDIAASYAIDNVTAPILSLSFGLCEANVSDTEAAFYDELWQQAAAQGMTVFVSAGDAGSSGCNAPENAATVYGFGVNGLASSAYTVAVGGTEFNDADPTTYWNNTNAAGQLSVKGYVPEAVWNESCNGNIAPSSTNCAFAPYEIETYSGGGGFSSCVVHTTDEDGNETCVSGHPKPSWQTGSGVPDDGARDLPDLSLAAAAEHDGYLLCIQGACQWTTNSDGSITLEQAEVVGGTSAAAPSMAGIMALIEQKQGQFQGVANYQLYKIAAGQDYASCDSSQETDPTKTNACIFHDITTGSNAVPCSSGSPNCDTTPSSLVKPAIGLPPRGSLVLDGYSAVSGYDLASGLGSINAANLLAAWGANSTLPTTTTLSVSKTSFAHGTSITLGSQVAPESGKGTPSGDVLFKASTTGNVLTGTLDSGKFSGSTIDLPGGTYNLTSQYSGDATFSASTSPAVSVTVTPESSTLTGMTYAVSRFFILGRQEIIALTATQLGGPFWIQVQVAGASGSTAATGTIELQSGTTKIGTFPVSKSGLIYVQCGPDTPCDFGIGSYTFIAKYSGDASFKASTTTIPFTVEQGYLEWETFVNNQTPPTGGKVISTTYFDNDPSVIPTGTVTITRSDTGAKLGSGTIDKTGVATIAFNAPDGDYNVNASYAGDKNYTPGFQLLSEEVITQDAGSTAATVALSLGKIAPSMGQHTPYSVTVAPPKGATKTPIGFVTLYNTYGQIAGTVELSGGTAIGNVEWDQVGTLPVYATYSGDRNYAPANSPVTNVTVARATPTVNVAVISGVIQAGTQTSITASLSSAVSSTNVLAPTGTVQFFDALNGAAPQAIGNPQNITGGNGGTLLTTIAPVLASGTHVISALYSGDANWNSATGSAAAAIDATSPSFIATPPTAPVAVTAGQTASIAIATQSVLGFNTPVTLTCTGTLPVGVACNSATVAPGATGTLSLTTTAPGTASAAAAALQHRSLWALSGTASLAGLFFLFIPRRKRFYPLAVVLIALGLTTGVIGCGGSSAPKSTILSLTSSSTKVASGSSITFVAVIQSSSAPTGTVTFYDGMTAIGSGGAPQNGIASVSTTSLSVGTHAITAKFAGDSHNTASSSTDTLEQTVTGSFTVTVNATAGTETETLSVPVILQ
jgi:hypothetical protein